MCSDSNYSLTLFTDMETMLLFTAKIAISLKPFVQLADASKANRQNPILFDSGIWTTVILLRVQALQSFEAHKNSRTTRMRLLDFSN